MAIYLFVPMANNAQQLGAAVVSKFTEIERYKIANDAGWFVRYAGTTVEVSNFVGLTGQADGVPPTLGSVLVTHVTSYYGRGSADMWEWLKTRMESGA